MNPWIIVGWVGALGISLVIAAIVLWCVVSVARSLKTPQDQGGHGDVKKLVYSEPGNVRREIEEARHVD